MTEIDPATARRAREAVPSIPCDAEGPVFREPWEARAFAMTLALYDRGLFQWPEWAAILGDEIKKAQAAGDPDTGETYYRHWLAALERIVAAKGVTANRHSGTSRNATRRRVGSQRLWTNGLGQNQNRRCHSKPDTRALGSRPTFARASGCA